MRLPFPFLSSKPYIYLFFLYFFSNPLSVSASVWSSGQCPADFICPVTAASAVAACASVVGPDHVEIYQTIITYPFSLERPDMQRALCRVRIKETKQEVLWRFRPQYTNFSGAGCDVGFEYSEEHFGCIKKHKPENSCVVGNPIILNTGDKFQKFDDYHINIKGHIANVERFYISDLIRENYEIYEEFTPDLSSKWSFGFSDYIEFNEVSTLGVVKKTALIHSDSGAEYAFYSLDGLSWNPVGTSNLANKLEPVFNENQVVTAWKASYIDQRIQQFNVDGYLAEEFFRQSENLKYSIQYEKSSAAIDDWDRVLISYGNELLYSYSIKKLRKNYLVLSVMIDSNTSLNYEYDQKNNLISASYYDGSIETYHYENSSYGKALTGITNRNGERYVSWAYDNQGRAVMSEKASGVETFLLDYSKSNDVNDPQVKVTNPLGKITTYHYSTNSQGQLLRVDGHASDNCAAANQAYTYDANGFMASKTDWKGNVTTYIHNPRGLEESRTEASGTPEARTIHTEWHPTFNLRTKVTEPARETIFTYDINGRLISQEVSSL